MKLTVLFIEEYSTKLSTSSPEIFKNNKIDENSVIRKYRITAEIAKDKAKSEFEKYRIVQDQLFESDFDKLMLNELKK